MTSRTRYGLLAMLLGAALMLAGCGGDDGVDEGVHAQLQEELADAQADLDQAQDDLADTQADLDQAQDDLADTQADLDQAQDDLADAQADEDQAQDDLADTQADLDQAQQDLVDDQAGDDKALMDVQDAADAAAMAAKTASDAAATDATAAAMATEDIATLQTVAMKTTDTYTTNRSMMMAMEAKKAAAGAMMAYEAAKKAAIAADEAETIEAATEAKVMAEAAQMDAEMYAMTASEQSMGAVEYAKMELMIDGTMKSVGESMLHDDDDTRTTPEMDEITGFISGQVVTRITNAVPGQHFVQNTGPANEVKYQQAVAAGGRDIGRTVDTSDDMNRLRIIDKYQSSQLVRVFVDGNGDAPDATLQGLLSATGGPTAGGFLPATGTVAPGTAGFLSRNPPRSVGMYYQAIDVPAPAILPNGGALPAAPQSGPGALDAFDTVLVNYPAGSPRAGSPVEGVEIFELSGRVDDGLGAANSVTTVTHYARVVDTVTDANGNVTRYFQPVDIIANDSMTDGGDNDNVPEDINPVTVRIPMDRDYQHLHFGVWASLGEADDNDGSQMLDELGIGFLQNISGSDITQKQGIGTAVFRGDWVAAVQRAHAEGEGSIVLDDGKATLTADFGKGEFTGVLTGLATLEGELDGNGFSGTTVTVPAVASTSYGLIAGSDFDGMFEGGIYGADGAEAGGVFDFSSESSGGFRGAFGGHRDGSP